MGFLKNMISGKDQNEDELKIEDVAALVDEAEAEPSDQADAFAKMAEIQSRIKATQSEPVQYEEPEEAMLASSDQISDFADVVRGIKETETDEQSSETVLSAVMTDDDFEKLDEELARMSDELEQEATNDNFSPQTPVPNGQDPSAPAEPEAAAPIQDVPENEELPEEVEEPETSLPDPERNLATIQISEQQGGGAAMPVDAQAAPDDVDAQAAPDDVDAQAAPDDVDAQVESDDIDAQVASDDVDVKEPMPIIEDTQTVEQPPEILEVPAPAAGRSGRRAGRVKTRLLGFEHSNGKTTDPFSETKDKVTSNRVEFPVGWIVVVNGPGFGSAFALFNGVSQIGRGAEQAISLDFGDTSISRENHAAVAYDGEQNKFFLGHGGKANLVRLNDSPVLTTEEIVNSDIIRIGETTLRFVSLCGADFNWDTKGEEDQSDAAIA